MSIEPLENRLLMSIDIHWHNRGVTSEDPFIVPESDAMDLEPDDADTPDNFEFVFGTQAEAARNVVDAALNAWERVITDFNDDNNDDNVYTVTIVMDTQNDASGGRARTPGPGDPWNGIPDEGAIIINANRDANNMVQWFVDPTPNESSEFMGTLVNAFCADAQGGSAAAGFSDLFSTVAHEMAHLLGMSRDEDFLWEDMADDDNDPAIQPTGQSDTALAAGEDGDLWRYDDGGVKALFTTYNAGSSNNGNSDFPIHIAQPDAQNVYQDFYGARDLGNASRPDGRRSLPSLLLSRYLREVYGYDLTWHEDFPNFYIHLDAAGKLTVRGGGDGEANYPPNYPSTGDSNDIITLSSQGDDLVVEVDIGIDVPGTGVDTFFRQHFPINDVDSIEIFGYDGVNWSDGDDSITLDFSNVNWFPTGGITVNGGGDVNQLLIIGPPGDGHSYDITGSNVSFDAWPVPLDYHNIDELTVMAEPGSSGNTMQVTTTKDLERLVLVGGDGPLSDTISVVDVFYSMENIEINALGGDDVIRVKESGTNAQLKIDTGWGKDQVRLGAYIGTLDDFADGKQHEIDGGPPGQDVLLMHDFNTTSGTGYSFDVGFPPNYPAGEGTISRHGLQFFLHRGMGQVTLEAGNGNDQFSIAGTPVDSHLTVLAHGGDDEFYVRSKDTFPNVGKVHSLVAIHGGPGTNTATVDDSGDGTGDTVTVTETTVGAGPNDDFFGYKGKLEYHELDDLTIHTSGGNDVINVESTAKGTETTINASRGNDTITVASPPDPNKDPGNGDERERGTVDHIESILTLNGEVGDDLLTIVDVDDPTGDVVTLTDMTVGMGTNDTFLAAGGGIVYTSFDALRLLEGAGGDTSAVESTHQNTRTFIQTGDGDDTVSVENPVGTVNDIRNVLVIDGQVGADKVAVEDAAEALGTTVTITNKQVGAGGADNLFGGGLLAYANLEELKINVGKNDDMVFIESTAQGTPTMVNTGDGTDLITVEYNGKVDPVRSHLTIDGGGGPANVLALIDTADATSDHVTITGKEVGMEVGDSFFGPGGGLEYANLTQINVATGSGHDNVELRSTNPSTKMLIGTGAGDDVIWVDSNGQATGGDVELIRSQVEFIGGAGNNALAVDDSDDPTGDTVSVTPKGSVAGLIGQGPSDDFFGTGGGIEYEQIGILSIQTSASAADSINITPAPAGGTMIGIDGNDPIQSTGDTLNLDLDGTGSPSVSVLDKNCGMLTSSTHADVLYREIETIHEVSGSDFDLLLDMNVPPLGGNDGISDTVLAEIHRQDEVRMLNLLVNDAVVFTGDESAVNSLTVIGSSDDDTLRIAETEEGLPILRGDAPLGHTNQSFADSGRTPTNVSIHYRGGPGAAIDRYDVMLAGPHDVAVFQDLIAALKSGVVNVDGAFTLSYESLTPIKIQGAGGTLMVDATLLSDTTEMLQTNRGGGTYEITGDGGFETTTLSGFDDLVVIPPAEVSLRTKVAAGPSSLGVSRESQYFYLDATRNGRWDRVSGGDVFSSFGLGQLRNAATAVVGDWDGDGTDELGLYNNGCFYLDTTGNGRWDRVAGGDTFRDFGLGAIRDVATPIVGDWDGNGTDDLGLYNNGYVYLDTTGNGRWDRVRGGDTFHDFGIGAIRSVATPIVGDWGGDGTDDLGLYNEGYFYLDSNGNGRWDRVRGGDTFHDFGMRSLRLTATPVIGDWDGDGTDNIGLHNERYFYLDATGNGRWDRVAGGDMFHDYGLSGTPIIGHWASVSPLLAAGGPAVAPTGAEQLTFDALTPIVDHAIAVWAESGLNQAEPQRLAGVQLRIADLPGARLGEASGTTITLDVDAAGYGWFVDATPEANEEFNRRASQGLLADASEPAADQMDLLTVVMHELGHLLGHSDHCDGLLSNDVMNGLLPVGVRRTLEHVDSLFSNTEELDDILVTLPPAGC